MSSRTCSSLVFIASPQPRHLATAASQCLRQVLLYRAGRDTETVADLLTAQPVHVLHHHGCVPPRRKLPENFAQPLHLLRNVDLRITSSRLAEVLEDRPVLDVYCHAAAPLASRVLLRKIARYREQIGLHVPDRVRVFDAKHSEIDLLNQSARVRTVTDAPVKEC